MQLITMTAKRDLKRMERCLQASWERIKAGEGVRTDFRRVFAAWGELLLLDQLTLMEHFKERYPATWEIVNRRLTPDTRAVLI